MPAIANWSPDQISLIVGGFAIVGGGPDDFVVFRAVAPIGEVAHTVDGRPIRSQSAIRSGLIEITVSQVCPGYRDMETLLAEQFADPTAVFPVRCVNPITGDVVTTTGAQFVEQGELSMGATAGSKTYVLLCPDAMLPPSLFGSLITG